MSERREWQRVSTAGQLSRHLREELARLDAQGQAERLGQLQRRLAVLGLRRRELLDALAD
jgi:hypothetical protein